MTMWTIEQFCDATNSYGCRVTKLFAPLPATPSSAPDVAQGNASTVITLNATSASGTGFFDPGPNLPGVPAFSHIQVVITNTGVTGTPPTVNSVTYVNPTTLQLDVNTQLATPNIGTEKYAVKVINPDGQQVEGLGVLRVVDNPVATRLAMFAATPIAGGVELRWQFASDAPEVSVERRLAGQEEWSAVTVERHDEGDVHVAVDRSVEDGQSYAYRLVAATETFGPIPVTAGGAQPKFTLEAVRPNPTSGAAQVAFTLAKSSPVEVNVLDVQGREVAKLLSGIRPAGHYLTTWDGRGPQGPASAGVYFVRMKAGSFVQTRRLSVAR
jgi:hypothetical protein